MSRPSTLLLLLVASVTLAGACTRKGESQTITVFAAASLGEAFAAIERAYEAEHPGVDVELNFAGSQLLAIQLLEGASAQVFASADAAQLDRVAAELELLDRRRFASNRIVIAVPAGSALEGVQDLTEPGVRVVLAGETVPAGRYARLALEQIPVDSVDLRAAVERNVVSNETDVRAVVAKVRLGEADAGLVYATDVIGDAALELRELPELTLGAGLSAGYELAVLGERNSEQLRGAAVQFVDFVTGPRGQAILAEHGFGPPPP
ncbi:MAG: molybdate ABC transporter substrate-binding protein [Enhygromyxa sp.]